MAAPQALNIQKAFTGFSYHTPKWDGPDHVRILVTTKQCGHSKAPYAGFNLALHVNDDVDDVLHNREILRTHIGKNPVWLNQIHSSTVISRAKDQPMDKSPTADGVVSTAQDEFLNILTADCLPILLTDKHGEIIGACHAGWRGLANGILQNTLQEMVNTIRPDSITAFYEGIHVYIGPAIGQSHYEVGVELKDLFSAKFQLSSVQSQKFFLPSHQSTKFYADLFGLAIFQLNSLKISQVNTEKLCTFSATDYFYSYRRNAITGRFTSCIWLE